MQIWQGYEQFSTRGFFKKIMISFGENHSLWFLESHSFIVSHTSTHSLWPITMAELFSQRQTSHEALCLQVGAVPGTREWWRPHLVTWWLLDQPCQCAPSRDNRHLVRSAEIRKVYGTPKGTKIQKQEKAFKKKQTIKIRSLKRNLTLHSRIWQYRNTKIIYLQFKDLLF